MRIYVRTLSQRVGTPQDIDGVDGVACVRVGEPVPLFEAQAERGFANVAEKALEDLLLMKGKKVPDGDEDDIDRRTDLQMACIAAIKPDCTDVEAAAYVEKAFVIEHPDVNLDPLVTDQDLSDVFERRGVEGSCRVRSRRQGCQGEEEAREAHAQNELAQVLQEGESSEVLRETKTAAALPSHTAGE